MVISQKASGPVDDAGAVQFLRIPTNRVWTRDYGPIFVQRNRRRSSRQCGHDWRFNAWAKYDDWKLDVRQVPRSPST